MLNTLWQIAVRVFLTSQTDAGVVLLCFVLIFVCVSQVFAFTATLLYFIHAILSAIRWKHFWRVKGSDVQENLYRVCASVGLSVLVYVSVCAEVWRKDSQATTTQSDLELIILISTQLVFSHLQFHRIAVTQTYVTWLSSYWCFCVLFFLCYTMFH